MSKAAPTLLLVGFSYDEPSYGKPAIVAPADDSSAFDVVMTLQGV